MALRRHIVTTKGASLFNPNIPVYVNRVDESFALSEHNHDFLELTYVSEGSGFHYIGDQTIPVSKGDLFWIPLGVSHVFRPASTGIEHRLAVYNCVFAPAFFDQLLQSCVIEKPWIDTMVSTSGQLQWRQYKNSDGLIDQLMKRMFFEYNLQAPGFVTQICAVFMQIIVWMQRQSMGLLQQEQQSSITSSLQRCIERIHERCGETEMVEQAAAAAGLGVRQFQRKFRELTGMSYIQYVQHVRIEKSCMLLSTTSQHVHDIAHTVGYDDMKFFNQLFMRIMGTTPRQYRTNAVLLM